MPKIITKEQEDRLNRHGWVVGSWNSELQFEIIHDEGSQIKNSSQTLDMLLHELKELESKDLEFDLPRVTDEELLNMNDYYYICEHPKEISSNLDNTILITGWAANTLLQGLRNKFYQDKQ